MPTKVGSPELRETEILRCVVGSKLHGLNVEDSDDTDYMGVAVEPTSAVFGPRERFEHYIYRTAAEGERSGPGDVDLTIYSLRKYLRLALDGNPSILTPLFAPASAFTKLEPDGLELIQLAPFILSRQAGRRFLGYLDAQYERMMGGGKQNRVPNRPELIEKYGFDTKFAGHAVRLALQGIELMQEGKLTLPMAENERELILGVRLGKHSKETVANMVQTLRSTLQITLDHPERSPLREYPDVDAVIEFSTQTHLLYWENKKEDDATT